MCVVTCIFVGSPKGGDELQQCDASGASEQSYPALCRMGSHSVLHSTEEHQTWSIKASKSQGGDVGKGAQAAPDGSTGSGDKACPIWAAQSLSAFSTASPINHKLL